MQNFYIKTFRNNIIGAPQFLEDSDPSIQKFNMLLCSNYSEFDPQTKRIKSKSIINNTVIFVFEDYTPPVLPPLPTAKVYKTNEYTLEGAILVEKWFNKKTDDVYSDLYKQVSYTYDGGILIQTDTINYDSKGTILNHLVSKFFTDKTTNKIITETEVL